MGEEMEGLLTSRIHACTNHLADVEHHDGQRADGVSQRRVDFDRRARGFLVRRRRVVAAFFDGVLKTAIADSATIAVEGPIGSIVGFAVGKTIALPASEGPSPVEGHWDVWV